MVKFAFGVDGSGPADPEYRRVFSETFRFAAATGEHGAPDTVLLDVQDIVQSPSAGMNERAQLVLQCPAVAPEISGWREFIETALWTVPDHLRPILVAMAQALPERPLCVLLIDRPLSPLLLKGLVRLVAKRMLPTHDFQLVVTPGVAARVRQVVADAIHIDAFDTSRRVDTIFVLSNVYRKPTVQDGVDTHPAAGTLLAHGTQMVELYVGGNVRHLRISSPTPRPLFATTTLPAAFYPFGEAHAFAAGCMARGSTKFDQFGIAGRIQSNFLGPVDAFGFRIAGALKDFRAARRHFFVVAIFGGSAAHGDKCFHDDTIAGHLQHRIRNHFASTGDRRIPVVLNFGISSRMILDEMMFFLVQCVDLRPDVVISHSGFNDAFMGMLSDKELLRDYAVTYHIDEFKLRFGAPAGRHDSLNNPRMIATMLTSRIRQFVGLAASQGSRFLYGLQPLWFARPPTDEEKAAWDEYQVLLKGAEMMSERLERLPHLYEVVERQLEREAAAGRLDLVNCQAAFRALSTNASLFFDYSHLTPAGNATVAELYWQRVRALLPAIPAMAEA